MERDMYGRAYSPAQDDALVVNEEAAARAEIERGRWEKIMLTKDGRWVMWQILSELGFRGSVYGERHAGKHDGAVIISDTLRNHNVELYHQMIVENDR